MKTVKLQAFGDINTKDVLVNVISNGGASGLSLDDLRRRCRVLAQLEHANEKVDLEDADYQTVVTALRAAKFSVASPHLLSAIEAVLSA